MDLNSMTSHVFYSYKKRTWGIFVVKENFTALESTGNLKSDAVPGRVAVDGPINHILAP
jgi:hypothetical protein